MKTLITVSIAFLLFSCANPTTNQEKFNKNKAEENVVICTDSIFLNEGMFPQLKGREIVHDFLFPEIRDYPKVETKYQHKLKNHRYFSDRTYCENFHTYLLFQGSECEDCKSYIILYNISKKNGCVIDKINLSTSYAWEAYKLYLKTDFLNDSTFTRIDYYAGNLGTDSTEYGPNWEEKIITNEYRITNIGNIDLIETDSVKKIYDHKFF